MAFQRLPAPIRAYQRDQAAIRRGAVREVRKLWRTVGDDFSRWEGVRGAAVDVVTQSQMRTGQLAAGSTQVALAATGQPVGAGEYLPLVSEWRGVAGDGRPVATLLDGAVVNARKATARGLSAVEVQRAVSAWLTMATVTVLADTMRGIEQMGIHAHSVRLYVRAVAGANPCGRCIILAGKTYATETAFERHPQCQCYNIPATDANRAALVSDPQKYLESLDDEGLAHALGSKANAKAFRDGADAVEIVNAYRSGIQKAQIQGVNIRYTTSGVTRRGFAGRRMRTAGLQGQPRLMPSSIYELAPDRASAIQMLRNYGWIV